jgi:hypothetical protein
MCDGHAGGKAGQCAAKRARRVTLDDQQGGGIAKQRQQLSGYPLNVKLRVFLPGTAETNLAEVSKAERLGVEGLLSRQHDRRREAARGERMGDGRQFDGFRPGPDDQPDIGETQPSPLTRPRLSASVME